MRKTNEGVSGRCVVVDTTVSKQISSGGVGTPMRVRQKKIDRSHQNPTLLQNKSATTPPPNLNSTDLHGEERSAEHAHGVHVLGELADHHLHVLGDARALVKVGGELVNLPVKARRAW